MTINIVLYNLKNFHQLIGKILFLLGSSFDYKISKRFGFSFNYKLNVNTQPGQKFTNNFLIGTRMML